MAKKAGRSTQAKNQRTTLKDVAHQAGVSTAAASLVLNNKPNRFTQETRDIIRESARLLGYVPNQSARSLATQSSSLFALIIPDIENLFFASLSKYIEDECRSCGYSLIISDTSENIAEQESAIRRMIQLGVDGLFIVPAYDSFDDPDILKSVLDNVDFPVIFLDRYPNWLGSHEDTSQWSAFAYDHERGGRLVADLLVDCGHSRIAAIGPMSPADKEVGGHNDAQRLHGFFDQLRMRGISIDASLMGYGSYRVSTGRELADTVIDGGVTAVFCGNDLIALGFIREAYSRGLSIPRDISVVGYDDVMAAFGLDFQLTTVKQDVAKLAGASVRHMVHLCLDKENAGQVVTLLDPSIVMRTTVKNLSA